MKALPSPIAFHHTTLEPQHYLLAVQIADAIFVLTQRSGEPAEVRAVIERRMHSRRDAIWHQAKEAPIGGPAVKTENVVYCITQVNDSFVGFCVPASLLRGASKPDARSVELEENLMY